MTDGKTTKTKREAWIGQRADELVATGWKPATAMKRAMKEWRKISPQHVAAQKRNADMAQARADRLATLPASDPLARL